MKHRREWVCLYRRMQDTRYVLQRMHLGMLSRLTVMNEDGWSTCPWKDVHLDFWADALSKLSTKHTFHIFAPLEIQYGNEFHRKSKNKGAESLRELRPV